jgi:hypothetical protein
MRAYLSCPVGDGERNYALLTDLLGVELDARLPGGPVQTLLLKFMNSGRVELSVNFYNKLAAATAEAAKTGIDVCEAGVRAFLEKHVRVDITMQEATMRALVGEARLGNKDKVALTAAMFLKAVRRLDRRRGRSGKQFVPWLLGHIFDERLALLQLLQYRPAMLGEVAASLDSYNADAAEVFGQWRALGFRSHARGGPLSFQQFATTSASSPVTRQIARTMQRKALAVGLSLDIPLAAYDALFVMTHVFDMTNADRHAFAVALETKDQEAIATLMRRSRKNTTVTIGQVHQLLESMIENAHVPARRIGRSSTT